MIRRALVVVAGLSLALLEASVPLAMATTPDQSGVPISWNGPTKLDWQGQGYAVADDSFLGTPVVVPGDQVEREATITNTGPGAATATVEIIDATVTNPPGTLNTDLQNNVHLTADAGGKSYDATWHQAIDQSVNGVSWQTTVLVPRGDSFNVDLGAYFPATATGGRSLGGPSEELSVDVKVVMVGDTTNTPAQPGGRASGSGPGSGSGSGTGSPGSGSSTSAAASHGTAEVETGGFTALNHGIVWLVAIGVVGIVVATEPSFLALVRRRRH